MKKSIKLLNLFFITLMFASCSLFTDINWDFNTEEEYSVYPSAIIALAEYDEENIVNAIVDKYNKNFSKLKNPFEIYIVPKIEESEAIITIKESDFWYESTITKTLYKADKRYYFRPEIRWKYTELRKLNQPTPVEVIFNLNVNGVDLGEKSKTFTLRSINECLYGFIDNNEFRNLKFMYAAYVNEDHPEIQKILKEGLQFGIVDSYSGYQSNNVVDVYSQIVSIWKALQNRGIKYCNLTETSNNSAVYYSQRVRSFNESLNYSQANCVDGTVLMASILKAIGIDPVLVSVPGHMFLGFYADKQHKNIDFLETTLLGQHADCDSIDIYKYDIYKDLTLFDTFINANNKGIEEYNNYKDKDGIYLIDLKKVRKVIKPIGL